MFTNAQDIQNDLQACKQIQNEGLDAQEHESEYEHKIVDQNLEHRIDNIMGPLEVSNVYDCAKNYIPLVERRSVVLSSKPSHDKQGAGYFMYSFVDSQEDEFANQFVEEQINISNLFLLDDVVYDVGLPIYRKYEDDHDVEDFIFQKYSEEQSIRSTVENSLPLCFAAFKLLKDNSNIIIEENEFVMMQNHTKPTKQIDKILQHSPQVFDISITCCVAYLVRSKVQQLVEDKAEKEHVQKSKDIEKRAYDNSEEIGESLK